MIRSLVVVAVFFVVGCASAPPVAVPELSVAIPESWTAATAPTGQVPVNWWEDFGEPSLTTVVETVLTRNFDLQGAAARLEVAAADARIAASGLQPSIDGSYNGARRKQNFVGLPIPNTEISIRDDDGKEVKRGEPGEICVRGPQVMKGYWQNEEATAETIGEDGFLKTGDIGTLNKGGFLAIVDRKKDMILVSGFNVYPNEIEDVVSLHPDIIEAACIGVPNKKTGEAVKLFVVKSNPSLNEKEIIAYCKENLAAYKIPKQIEFINELPKTNVGKVLRRKLRE